MHLIGKREAREAGLTRYFTGKECPRGHVSQRMVSTGGCVDCLAEKKRAWNSENLARNTARKREWRRENPERVKAVKAAWNAANPEGQAVRARRWADANPDKVNAASAKWRKANPAIVTAAANRRRARVLGQTPPWADHDKILEFYREARRLTLETGIEHHVDHIVPLAGKLVRGLHCEGNLQILPAFVNRSKSNRFSEGI